MFTARYALNPYITQIRFVFKGLISPVAWNGKIFSCSFLSFLISPLQKEELRNKTAAEITHVITEILKIYCNVCIHTALFK